MGIQSARFTVPDQINTVVVPGGVTYAIIKNVGLTNSFRINFNSDGASNYWTIAPGVSSPVLRVTTGDEINTDGVGGSTTAEVIMWD